MAIREGWTVDEIMMAEWEAWQRVCREFERVIGGINNPKYNVLCARIRHWGELLHALRATQQPEIIRQALELERLRLRNAGE